MMNAIALFREKADPTDEEIKEYLAGNLCRCSGYEGQLRCIRAYLDWKKQRERRTHKEGQSAAPQKGCDVARHRPAGVCGRCTPARLPASSLRSPHANAIVKSINKTAAMKVPAWRPSSHGEDVDQTAAATRRPVRPIRRRVRMTALLSTAMCACRRCGGDLRRCGRKCVDKAMKLVKVEYEC